ncbi:MAG: CRISPR-associated ring nuclease Csm6 [Dissulfuribacterales bacterium]
MKHILFAVLGITPQVLTEALYALHKAGKDVDTIEVITTQTGCDLIHSLLLAGGDGAYHRYLKDYGIPSDRIQFDINNITILTDINGKPMDDITSLDENRRLILTILKKAKELTASSDTAVYFLIAGGRKTMSAALSLAAQLYGRPQDRIYHVLVSPAFESCRNFFYPPPKPIHIELIDKDGKPFLKDTRYAHIELVNMPFVSIRDKLPVDLLDNLTDINELSPYFIMDEPYKLIVDLNNCQISFAAKTIKLMPSIMAIYAFLVKRKINCTRRPTCDDCHDCFMDIQEIMDANTEIVEIYKKLVSIRGRYPNEDGRGIYALCKDDFFSYRSKIERKLRNAFGHGYLAKLYISAIGKKPNTRYGIRMDKNHLIVQK